MSGTPGAVSCTSFWARELTRPGHTSVATKAATSSVKSPSDSVSVMKAVRASS